MLKTPLDQVDIPATPTQYAHPETAKIRAFDMYRGLIFGLVDWRGYGYTSQQNGVIINDIVPLEGKKETEHHSASQLELGLHTEDASYNFAGMFPDAELDIDMSPNMLTLQYLRNPHHTPTTVSILDTAALSKDTRDTLATEQFQHFTNPAQGGKDNDANMPVPILYGTNGNLIRLNCALTKPDAYTGKHREALSELFDHLESRYLELPLTTGDLAIIDNRRVLHGRAAYKKDALPRYDGMDRWQKRLVAATNADRIKQFESLPRIVDPKLLLGKLAVLQSN